jgi:hypothetical protein
MDPTILDKRPKLPSILTTYRPVEDYWGSFGPSGAHGPDVERLLDPFDVLLAHLVLERVPGFPVLVDLATGSTWGASSVIGLSHPHVGRVVAVTRDGSVAGERAVSALRGYVRGRDRGKAPLDVLPIGEISASLTRESRVVILADARGADADSMAEEVRLATDALPDALILVLGLGRVGECPGIDALLRLGSHASGWRFRLFRELGEVLAASHLGLLARADHPFADEVLLRIRQLYDGNFHFLELLKSVNQAAMQATQVDAEVMKTHPLSRPLRVELDALKQEADRANHALAEITDERDRLRSMVVELTSQTIATTPFPAIVRRKLALGFLGKVYRTSKRIIRQAATSTA